MKMLKGVGNSTHGNKQEKLNAYDQKERKVSLLTDDMIVCIANSKESIKKKKKENSQNQWVQQGFGIQGQSTKCNHISKY